MRVLLVTNDYPPKPGGIQQFLGSLMAVFPGEVRVLAPADRGSDPRVVRHRDSFMHPTPGVRRWVQEQAAAFRPDVVLFGAPHPLAVMGPALRAALGVPYGVICYGAEVTVFAAIPGARQRLLKALRSADIVFGLSRYTCGRVERLIARPVPYLGAGVDAAFTPGEPPSRPVIGCVSRFVPRKGQRRVLRAAALLSKGQLSKEQASRALVSKVQASRERASRAAVWPGAPAVKAAQAAARTARPASRGAAPAAP